jgi:alkylation response protein AidB-like acyl-CoA dehydrogenase
VRSGKKYICLAVSEAYAGSDVAGLTTTAVKSADGKTWTINGSKKWITGCAAPLQLFISGLTFI